MRFFLKFVELIYCLEGRQVWDVQSLKEFLQLPAVAEQRHLLRRLSFGADLASSVLLALGFQVGQHFPGTVDHALGQPGQLGHVHAVALVGPAGDYLM